MIVDTLYVAFIILHNSAVIFGDGGGSLVRLVGVAAAIEILSPFCASLRK